VIAFVLLPAVSDARISCIHVVAFTLFVGNWSVAALRSPQSPVSPLWSVSVEEQF